MRRATSVWFVVVMIGSSMPGVAAAGPPTIDPRWRLGLEVRGQVVFPSWGGVDQTERNSPSVHVAIRYGRPTGPQIALGMRQVFMRRELDQFGTRRLEIESLTTIGPTFGWAFRIADEPGMTMLRVDVGPVIGRYVEDDDSRRDHDVLGATAAIGGTMFVARRVMVLAGVSGSIELIDRYYGEIGGGYSMAIEAGAGYRF